MKTNRKKTFIVLFLLLTAGFIFGQGSLQAVLAGGGITAYIDAQTGRWQNQSEYQLEGESSAAATAYSVLAQSVENPELYYPVEVEGMRWDCEPQVPCTWSAVLELGSLPPGNYWLLIHATIDGVSVSDIYQGQINGECEGNVCVGGDE